MPVGLKHALLGVWTSPGTTPTWIRQDIEERSVAALNTNLVIIAARRFVASATDDFGWLRDNIIANRAAFIELIRNRPTDVGEHGYGET
jgi:hypothetical protein